MSEAANERFDGPDREHDSSREGQEPRQSIEARSAGPTFMPGQTERLELSDLKIVIETAWVPPGAFLMGSPETEDGRDEDEGPQHLVRISRGFWMMTTEVQAEQWEAVMCEWATTNWFLPSGPASPVASVSWFEAVEFANKLTESVARLYPKMNLRPGYAIDVRQRDAQGRIMDAAVRPILGNRGYRLPTEAEWEYACRAGTTGPSHIAMAKSTDTTNERSNDDFRPPPRPRGFDGKDGKNSFGLLNMLGNLDEWVWDWYDEKWYEPGKWPINAAGERVDPTGPQHGSDRVSRGRSWLADPWELRSANRSKGQPSDRSEYLGFRLCLDAE